jgi:hypothetical protein
MTWLASHSKNRTNRAVVIATYADSGCSPSLLGRLPSAPASQRFASFEEDPA